MNNKNQKDLFFRPIHFIDTIVMESDYFTKYRSYSYMSLISLE